MQNTVVSELDTIKRKHQEKKENSKRLALIQYVHTVLTQECAEASTANRHSCTVNVLKTQSKTHDVE